MKRLTKARATQLTKGTFLMTSEGDTIELLSNYSDYHNGYEYVNIEYDDEGESLRTTSGYITSQEITHYYEV